MALNKDRVIKLYLRRLVDSMIPDGLGEEYNESFANDLMENLSKATTTNQNNIDETMNHFKSKLLRDGKREEWIQLNNMLSNLLNTKSKRQICNYLIFLKSLGSTQEIPESPKLHAKDIQHETFSNERVRLSSSLQSSPRKIDNFQYYQRNNVDSATLETIIEPYYHTIPEGNIIQYMSYALLGMDSRMFTFLRVNDAIEIPADIGTSYSSVLRTIFEAGMIYRRLQRFSSSVKGNLHSPIKISFLRCLDFELNNYLNNINSIFLEQPTTLIQVSIAVRPYTLKLRLLYTLANSFSLVGYDFISNLHAMAYFGDDRIGNVCKTMLSDVSASYYEILEHWMLQGELTDTNEEFFIRFKSDENDFNDIIEYLPQRIPKLNLTTEDLTEKIYQIGKTLIFLLKYCKELKWMNNYNTKYNSYLFQDNKGIQFMLKFDFKMLIDSQFSEVLNYFTIIVQSKYSLFQHIKYYKQFMFMNSGDFIEALIVNGSKILNQPANTLTANILSRILVESIENSSVARYPEVFKKRLDARILNLSHGSMGWEVFTLEYKISDLPICHILNHGNKDLEYLKMFSFLWKLRHFSHLLNQNFYDCLGLKKDDLKRLTSKRRRSSTYRSKSKSLLSIFEKKVLWLVKSFQIVNVFRFNLIKLISSITRFLSFDVIEQSFEQNIVGRFFKCSDRSHSRNSTNSLPPLNSAFTKKLEPIKPRLKDSLGFDSIPHNMSELTFDGLIESHEVYLRHITGCKLLSDSETGRASGISYVNQIYHFLEICFGFIKSSEEFIALTTNYVAVLNLEENTNNDDNMRFDDDLEVLEKNLKALISRIYQELYLKEFRVNYNMFVNDLRHDVDLRDLGRSLGSL